MAVCNAACATAHITHSSQSCCSICMYWKEKITQADPDYKNVQRGVEQIKISQSEAGLLGSFPTINFQFHTQEQTLIAASRPFHLKMSPLPVHPRVWLLHDSVVTHHILTSASINSPAKKIYLLFQLTKFCIFL